MVREPAGQETVDGNQEPDRDELHVQIQELPDIADRLSINEFTQPAVGLSTMKTKTVLLLWWSDIV